MSHKTFVAVLLFALLAPATPARGQDDAWARVGMLTRNFTDVPDNPNPQLAWPGTLDLPAGSGHGSLYYQLGSAANSGGYGITEGFYTEPPIQYYVPHESYTHSDGEGVALLPEYYRRQGPWAPPIGRVCYSVADVGLTARGWEGEYGTRALWNQPETTSYSGVRKYPIEENGRWARSNALLNHEHRAPDYSIDADGHFRTRQFGSEVSGTLESRPHHLRTINTAFSNWTNTTTLRIIPPGPPQTPFEMVLRTDTIGESGYAGVTWSPAYHVDPPHLPYPDPLMGEHPRPVTEYASLLSMYCAYVPDDVQARHTASVSTVDRYTLETAFPPSPFEQFGGLAAINQDGGLELEGDFLDLDWTTGISEDPVSGVEIFYAAAEVPLFLTAADIDLSGLFATGPVEVMIETDQIWETYAWVPEPTSVLLAVGACALLAARRR